MSRYTDRLARLAPKKRLATSGRNVEVQGGLIVDEGSERGVRCSTCGAVVALARWWHHGTSEDPHRTAA